jgi:hypothetical protein
MSGRRELNPVYIHPMDAYYRHTPARYFLLYNKYVKIAFVRAYSKVVLRGIRIAEARVRFSLGPPLRFLRSAGL